MTTLVVLADDLSGAAETAAALGARLGPRLCLWPDVPTVRDGRPVVVDLDSRHLTAADAEARIRATAGAVPGARLVTKIDSLLRGNVAAHVAGLAHEGLVVVAPALPEQGRTVVGGVVLDRGVPLDRTRSWALEEAPPPASVAAALGGLPVRGIGLETVRSADLVPALAATVGSVAVCDAETAADLTAVVTAAVAVDPGARLVGASALARALGPLLEAARPCPPAMPRPDAGGVLYVIGTGAPAAVEQVGYLAARTDLTRQVVAPGVLAGWGRGGPGADEAGRALAAALRSGTVVVQVAAEADPAVTGADVVAGLARLVASALQGAPDWPVRLMLTGGQTARAVLDALGCRRLALIREVHPGAVLLTTDAGWLVATRPGSHGDVSSLWAVHRSMHPTTTDRPHEELP